MFDWTCFWSVPGEVSCLRFQDISDRSVRVSWSAPEQENGVLLGYSVSWSVKDMPHTLKVKNISADQTDLLVTSLQVLGLNCTRTSFF